MSRLSFRPRPLDIHKKLPIVKCIKDFEDDDVPASTRNSQLSRVAPEVENEVHPIPSKKVASEIPTPQFFVVDTYERDYSQTFGQPNSYLRDRGARAEIGEFVEHDLDSEDEDWLSEFNIERKTLAPEMFESLLFKLEVLDHKARERAGVITPTLGSPIPVLLRLDAAIEALQAQTIKHTVMQVVYDYWKDKPPPPVNDTNPYNVFRPREKAHRLHTRRVSENFGPSFHSISILDAKEEYNVQSFEKLRQFRRNLDQAKSLLEALIKREEKKREVMDSEVTLQRLQMKYREFQHETEFLEDTLALPGFPPFTSKFGWIEEECFDSDDVMTGRARTRSFAVQNLPSYETNMPMVSTKLEFKRRYVPHGWPHKMDPLEPVLLFTKPLLPEKLAMAGILPPSDSFTKNGLSTPSYRFRGRICRGGRIIFDRWNPLLRPPIDYGNSYYMPPKPQPSTCN